jgi:hypothetical protein
MKYTLNKNTATKRQMHMLAIFLVPVVALILGAAAPELWAGSHHGDEDEIPFDVAEFFFELNNTDGDLGIHALIDGDAWKRLTIEDKKERKMLDVRVKGRLRKQGLTEIFFESAEPTFDELDPEDFFRRFPAGWYEIEGITLEGDELENEVKLTHVLPAPPEIFINGITAAEDCDAVLPKVDSSSAVVIEWEPVTMSHNEIGKSGVPLKGKHAVVNYEVVVEIDETPYKTSTILPPSATSFEVPPEIIDLVDIGDEIKFEVLVREASYNQTAIESCFVVK